MDTDINDMLPNDGSFFDPIAEPEEQANERKKDISQAQAAKPVLENLLAKVDAEIEVMENVDAIALTYETKPEEFMRAWYGVQEKKAYAVNWKNYLESLLITTQR